MERNKKNRPFPLGGKKNRWDTFTKIDYGMAEKYVENLILKKEYNRMTSKRNAHATERREILKEN